MSIFSGLLTSPAENARALKRYYHVWKNHTANLRATELQGKEPILVYQMGKVGSTTVDAALRRANRYSIHIHTLRKSFTPVSPNWPPEHNHMILSDFVRYRVVRKSKFKIITGVRDPISRNISAFFQNLTTYGYSPKALSDSQLPDLIGTFLQNFDHDTPIEWFDRELRGCLGINVFAHTFDKDHCIIEGQHPVLVLKVETSDDSKAAALRSFLGEDVKTHRENVASRKAYAAIYKKFVQEIRFPEELLARQYDSKYARHFYEPAEINGFLKKWQR